MSNSRTLLRKHKDAGMRRDADGDLIAYKRIKPGTRERGIIATWLNPDGRECRHHATKGVRVGHP